MTNLITTAIQLTSPSFKLESEELAAITKALKSAYLKKTSRAGLTYIDGELVKKDSDEVVELTMEDFIAELSTVSDGKNENFQKTIETMIHKLRPFYNDGVYAKFFRGNPASRSKKKRLFYAYDLDSLDSDPTLQSLMTMAVFEEIRTTMSKPENQGRTAFIVLEEFAMLGRDNAVFRKYVTDFAETARKKGWWLISLTPRPQNFFELPTGQALWATATNYVFLEMNNDNVDYVAKNSSLLDQASLEIIKSLRTVKGKYAEVFYTNKKKTNAGAFRYRQTDYDAWLAPTNALAAREADRALKKFSGRKWEALEYLAKKYPDGVVRRNEENGND